MMNSLAEIVSQVTGPSIDPATELIRQASAIIGAVGGLLATMVGGFTIYLQYKTKLLTEQSKAVSLNNASAIQEVKEQGAVVAKTIVQTQTTATVAANAVAENALKAEQAHQVLHEQIQEIKQLVTDKAIVDGHSI